MFLIMLEGVSNVNSAFFGLNIATQGLYTAKTSLDITNHNISNSETPGYSRQYGVQKASRPLPNAGNGMMGTGAEIVTVEQYRDTYLDVKYWNSNTRLGEYEVKNAQMNQIEALFNETSDVGFNSQFNDLFEALEKLSTNPGDNASRTSFVDIASSYARYFNDIGDQLSQFQREANFAIRSKVDEINNKANRIATLNMQIFNVESSGTKANDLRDERVKLIDELSKIVNLKAEEIEDANGKKKFTITMNGQSLIDGPEVNVLEVRERNGLNNPEDEPGMYDIYWQSGRRFYTNDPNMRGELKGYIDLRDGNNAQNFTGSITGGQNSSTITVANPSRTDLRIPGELNIEGHFIEYSNYTYESSTDEITFTLNSSCPSGVSDVKIGESMSFKGIPYYIEKLNEYVRTVARKFNEIHEQGNSGTAGELFTYDGYTGTPALDENNISSYDVININNFRFSEEIANDYSKIATTKDITLGESANDILDDLLKLKHDNTMFDKGEPENYIQALVSELGIDAKQAYSFETGQSNMLLLIENQRLSHSGVDLNEETNNIIKFQQAYNIAAKMISVMDEIYDVTINRMGV